MTVAQEMLAKTELYKIYHFPIRVGSKNETPTGTKSSSLAVILQHNLLKQPHLMPSIQSVEYIRELN